MLTEMQNILMSAKFSNSNLLFQFLEFLRADILKLKTHKSIFLKTFLMLNLKSNLCTFLQKKRS
jgi:hypothetical protein